MQNTSVVIHIGYHKAASTYLQRRIFPNLQANSVFLANYKPQIFEFAESGTAFETSLLQWVDDEIVQNYPSPHNVTLISREEFSGHAYGRRSISPFFLADTLKKAFPSAKILIVIRNQLNYMLSVYAYRVAIKGIEYRGLSRFLQEEGALGLFEKLEYDRLVQYYMDVFGKDRVLALPVELLNVQPDLFFERFTGFSDLPSIPFKQKNMVNPSTRLAFAINFWRPVNFLFAGLLNTLQLIHVETQDYYAAIRLPFYRFRENTTQVLNRKFGACRRLSIPHDIAEKEGLIKRYAESNARLEKLTHIELKSLGYP